MTNTNTLGARPTTHTFVQVGRLYLLVRDAYLSPPAQTRVKLLALEDLRRSVGDKLTCAGLPTDLATVTGVRLVETLRTGLLRAARTTVRQERELALIEILTSTSPRELGWATPLDGLAVELAGLLLPEMAPAKAAQLVRRHRATTRSLRGLLRPSRPGQPIESPVDVVAEMLSGVYGLARPAALCAALTALDATDTLAEGSSGSDEEPGSARAPRPPRMHTGVAGGALFDPLYGAGGPVVHRYVGSALAVISPEAFAHELAAVALVVRHRPDLVDPIGRHLLDLRDDLDAARAVDPGAAIAATHAIGAVARSPRRTRTTPRRFLLDWGRHPRLGGLGGA